MNMSLFRAWRGLVRHQSGSSLVVVMIMLSVIMVLGLVSTRLSLFGERAARNDRDRQIAFQNAEAALLDAELDMMGPNSGGGVQASRVCIFESKRPAEFVEGCGTLAKTGMCLNTTSPGEAWRSALPLYASENNTAVVDATNKTVQYGEFTGQSLPPGSTAKLPRYTIEAVRYAGTGQANDNVGSSTTPEYAFLVTAMGFGARVETRVLLQTLVYKPAQKPGSGC